MTHLISFIPHTKAAKLFLGGIKMKQTDFLVKVKKELCKYSNIPKNLGDYIAEVIKKDEEEHLLPQYSKEMNVK